MSAVVTTCVFHVNTGIKTLRGGRVDVTLPGMPKYLDYRLRQVAELKQVTIWTARSWRDSGSKNGTPHSQPSSVRTKSAEPRDCRS